MPITHGFTPWVIGVFGGIMVEWFVETSMDKQEKRYGKLKRRHNSLTKRLLGLMVGTIVIFALAFILALILLNVRDKREHESREAETILNSMTGSIEASMATYKDVSRLILLNEAVWNYLRAEDVDSGLRNDAKYGVMDVINICTNVDSVYIFRDDGYYMSTGRGEYILDRELMQDAKWLSVINDRLGGAVITVNGNGSIYRKNGQPILSIGRAIYDLYTQKKVGMMQFNISASMLEQICLSQNATSVCIVTDSGRYLAGNEDLASYFSADYTHESIANEYVKMPKGRRMISGCKVKDMPIVVMCVTRNEQDSFAWEPTAAMLLVLIAFSASVAFAALFITKNVTKPVNELSAAIEESRNSGYLKTIDVAMPHNEIGMLSENYNRLVEHVNELFKEVVEKEKSVQKAEMRVLHEQLKPHFLYNSLETISYMAFEAGAPNVHDALETLGSFYRNFFSKGDREIPLKTEINIIRDYLALQKLRYGDIINDEYDIAENTLELKIPKLILQPLVENSIYHGIRLTGEPGTISIKTFLEGTDLHIIVRDTGIGMTEDTIRKVLSKERVSTDAERHSGFGLRGTIERIRYYCNNDDVINIRSEVGEFTEIELVITDIAKGREIKNVQSNAD